MNINQGVNYVIQNHKNLVIPNDHIIKYRFYTSNHDYLEVNYFQNRFTYQRENTYEKNFKKNLLSLSISYMKVIDEYIGDHKISICDTVFTMDNYIHDIHSIYHHLMCTGGYISHYYNRK